jgi:hypothetical protein
MQTVDFNSLVPEMSEWDNGKGVDIDTWIACVGNYEHAIGYSRLFWPEFVEHEGCVFRESQFTPDRYAGFMEQTQGVQSAVEAVINHLHVERTFGDHDLRPTHDQLIYLGRVLKEMWHCKLRRDFPSKMFEVTFDEETDVGLHGYVVSFNQKQDEAPGQPSRPTDAGIE